MRMKFVQKMYSRLTACFGLSRQSKIQSKTKILMIKGVPRAITQLPLANLKNRDLVILPSGQTPLC